LYHEKIAKFDEELEMLDGYEQLAAKHISRQVNMLLRA